MEDRRKLVGDLERYDALLRLTTDHQASTAIEQLIRETQDRLNELDRADDRSGGADYRTPRLGLRPKPPLPGPRAETVFAEASVRIRAVAGLGEKAPGARGFLIHPIRVPQRERL
jgi:hypothetical protein